MVKCSLCDMEFRENSLLEEQKKVHERWHKNCKAEKRNTTEGEVKWL